MSLSLTRHAGGRSLGTGVPTPNSAGHQPAERCRSRRWVTAPSRSRFGAPDRGSSVSGQSWMAFSPSQSSAKVVPATTDRSASSNSSAMRAAVWRGLRTGSVSVVALRSSLPSSGRHSSPRSGTATR